MDIYACPTIKRIFLHCGKNNPRSQASAENIVEEIIKLTRATGTDGNTIFVSGLTARGDRWNAKVCELNRILARKFQEEHLKFIENSNINFRSFHLKPETTLGK